MSKKIIILSSSALLLLLVAVGIYLIHARTSASQEDFLHSVNSKLVANQHLSEADLQHLRILTSDKNRDMRAKAITSLSYSNEPEAKQYTLEAAEIDLSDKEWLVRHAALGALRRSHAPDRYRLATRMLNDPSSKVRDEAHRVLSDQLPQ